VPEAQKCTGPSHFQLQGNWNSRPRQFLSHDINSQGAVVAELCAYVTLPGWQLRLYCAGSISGSINCHTVSSEFEPLPCQAQSRCCSGRSCDSVGEFHVFSRPLSRIPEHNGACFGLCTHIEPG
jgi:hypothetical protein